MTVRTTVKQVEGAEATANKGVPNGYAALDASGRIPVSQSELSVGFYEELPANSPFPTSATWWTDITKTMKIVEQLFTYNGDSTVNTAQEKVYAANGVTVIFSFTDVYSYVSGFLTPTRTRSTP